MGDLYLWRQVFILTSTLFTTVSIGIMVAFPSVLIPAVLSTNSTDIEVTTDQVSLIVTSNGIAGIFGFFVLSPMLQIYGRKIVQITNNVLLLTGFIIFPLAHNFTALLAARIIQGVSMGGFFIQLVILSEYSDPKRRGYFMTCKKVAIAIAVVMCHALPLIWNWRQIATFAIIFPTVATIMTLFWPESPFYLAKKGRFKECEKSFVWLHGGSNLQELHLLHASQLQKTKNMRSEKWYTFLFKKYFIKPLVIVFFIIVIMESTGKHYFVVYTIEMMTDLVGDKSLAIYCSTGSDLMTIVALLSSCFIIGSFKRRTILFWFGIPIVALMLIICLVIVLKSHVVAWLAPVLLVLHSFIVNISIIPVCSAYMGELFSLEHKGWSSCLTGLIFTSLYTLMLKVTPFLMKTTGVGGVYATYGIAIALSLVVLYYIVPETKDRTLQEIENEFKGIELVNCDEGLLKK